MKISTSSLQDGFKLDRGAETNLWNKWVYWKKGIPVWSYRKERLCDVNDVLFVEQQINEKTKREQKVRELMSKVR